MNTRKHFGFTLIELLIAIAVLAIIVTIATNSYLSHIRKSRRTEALTTLLSMQLAEEHWRTYNTTYGSLAQVWSNVQYTTNNYYQLSISGNTATGYTLTATAQGGQANDTESGTSCATLTLTVSNGTITKSPSSCWLTN